MPKVTQLRSEQDLNPGILIPKMKCEGGLIPYVQENEETWGECSHKFRVLDTYQHGAMSDCFRSFREGSPGPGVGWRMPGEQSGKEGKAPAETVACGAPYLPHPPDKVSDKGHMGVPIRRLQGRSPESSSGLLPVSSHPQPHSGAAGFNLLGPGPQCLLPYRSTIYGSLGAWVGAGVIHRAAPCSAPSFRAGAGLGT